MTTPSQPQASSRNGSSQGAGSLRQRQDRASGNEDEQAKHQQPASQQNQDNKSWWVIQQNLEDLKKNPNNKPAKDSADKIL